MPFKPLDHFQAVHRHDREKQNLPHWRQWHTTYFITSRLAHSVPANIRQQWRAGRDAWLRAHGLQSAQDLDRLTDEQRGEYQREFTDKFHELLDAGHGTCVLRSQDCAALLTARLLAGHGTSYHLDAWVIMPNHLHALVEPAEGTMLGEVIRHWKGGSAHDINKLLNRRGPLWQAEPFDHIVRSEAQWNHFRRYIACNPEKAGLRGGYVLGAGAESGLTAEALLARFGLARE